MKSHPFSWFQFLFCILILFGRDISAQQVPNGNMEDWDTITVGTPIPVSWYSNAFFPALPCAPSVSSVERTQDSNNGNWAAKLEAKQCSGSGGPIVYVGFIALGNVAYPQWPHGLPYSNKPAELNFYYKFLKVGSDTGKAEIRLSTIDSIGKIGQTVAYGSAEIISSVNTYTLMVVPINYFLPDTPEVIQVSFKSSKIPGISIGLGLGANPGSTLWIDDISLSGGTLGTPYEIYGTNFNLYPNPATSHITIDHKGIHSGTAELYDTFGRLVIQQDLQPEETTISTSGLASGVYVVRISTADGQYARKVVVN